MNMELLKLLENIRSPFLDSIIGIITSLGEETVAVVVICMIYWCISKRTAYIIGVAFFLSGITVQCMKICLRINRPWVIEPSLNPVPSAMERSSGYSFPSGHTQAATALYGSLGAVIRLRTIKVVCFLIPFLVAFSRLYLGVHTILDVAASLAISFFVVFITVRLFSNDSVSKKLDLLLPLIMILYTVVVIVIAAVLFSNGTIEERYLSDCLKSSGAGIGFAVGMYVERKYIQFSTKAKSILWQVVKFVCGLAGVFIIQEGLKLIVGTGLIIDAARYCLIILWAMAFFPLIIKRFFEVPCE